MKISIHARSDSGLERDKNEDAFLVLDAADPSRGKAGRTEVGLELENRPALVAVADGMGGAAAGDLASELAIKVLFRRAAEAARDGGGPGDLGQRIDWLAEGIREANREIVDRGSEEGSGCGMGTTLTAVLLDDRGCALAHVGDSRAYHLRGQRLTQLSVDHSFVRSQIARGKLTPERAAKHPQRHQLLEALGVHDSPRVDRLRAVLRPGDRLLLCSDGVYDLVEDAEITAALGNDASPAEQTAALVDLSRERGGFDNITVAVVHLGRAR